MYKKYTIPLSIFIVFENINPIAWTSESFGYNNTFFFFKKSWFLGVNIFIKNEVFFSNTTLLENSAIDNKNNFNFLKNYNIFLKNKLLLFYIYYLYTLKCKLVLLVPFEQKLLKVKSLDTVFKSASWLERETGEMFKISYANKTDSRRLLLDYSKQENPLLKDYPVEGFNDVYYNFFEDQVVYNNSTSIEL